MITEACHTRPMQRRGPVDFEAVSQLGHMNAHSAQVVRDGGNPISFFYS